MQAGGRPCLPHYCPAEPACLSTCLSACPSVSLLLPCFYHHPTVWPPAALPASVRLSHYIYRLTVGCSCCSVCAECISTPVCRLFREIGQLFQKMDSVPHRLCFSSPSLTWWCFIVPSVTGLFVALVAKDRPLWLYMYGLTVYIPHCGIKNVNI